MCDVGARHIASYQHSVDIVRADGGMEHRPSTAGTNDTKIAGSSGDNIAQAGEDEGSEQQRNSAPHLFFAFHILYPSSKPAIP